MNSQTRILVIPLKKLLICAAILTAAILIILLLICSSGKSSSSAVNTSANVSSNQSNSVSPTYCPGVYTSSLLLNGTPLDIQVTVDDNNINDIEMVNLSESIETMYPMLSSSFNNIKEEVIKKGTTTNVSYDINSKYTSTILLDAINTALDKARTK